MFQRKIEVYYQTPEGVRVAAPLRHIDSFAMRTFTNDAAFDDSLPTGDGLLEIGLRVPLGELEARMSDWLRRKGHLPKDARLVLVER